MPDGSPDLVVDAADYLYFVQRAVQGMCDILAELGDELANTRPSLPGANTPYGLVTHCLGVVGYWGGRLVAGRPVQRDRDAEFTATGTVADLLAKAEESLRQLVLDLAVAEPGAPLREQPAAWSAGPDRPLSQAGALIHLYEELAQHHGQLQVIRDVLVAAQPPAGFDELPLAWLRAKRSVKWHRPGPDRLAAWVADMDFPIAAPIRDAIAATVDRGDLGYPDWPEQPLAVPFAERMQSRYGWSPVPEQVRPVSDLIQALQVVLTLASRPGDGVVAHLPNYPPFLATVTSMNRVLVPAPLQPAGADSWATDLDRLRADLDRTRASVLLLVNPQNPTGRVFSRAELMELAELAERYDLTVLCDEIHAELVHRPHQHVPFASLAASTAARTVTVTSATKAFNLAGLRTAVAHVGPAAVRAAWDAQPPDLFGAANVLGVAATLAAWTAGDAWQAGLTEHLLAQRERLVELVEGLPGVTMRRPQAGYLGWLDCTAAGLPIEPADWFAQRAGVELSRGADFGPAYRDFVRLNFATSSQLLSDIVGRLAGSLTG